MLRDPLADLEARPSVGLVVELDSHSRLERLEAPRQLAGDVHGAVEQLAVDDVRKVDVDVDPKAGIGCKELGPSLVAAAADVELDLLARERIADRAPPRCEVIRVRERLVEVRARR